MQEGLPTSNYQRKTKDVGKCQQDGIHQHSAVPDGWTLEGGCYVISWFEGTQVPEAPGEAEDDEAEESNSNEEVEPCSSDDANDCLPDRDC